MSIDQKEQYVVVSGNPFDGMHITGPFDDWEDASDYGEDHYSLEWLVVRLNEPMED